MGVRHFLSKDLRFKINLNYPGNVENKNRKISGFTYKEHREKIVDFS